MCRWRLKTDIKLIQAPACCMVIYLMWLILSKKLTFVSSISVTETNILIGTQILFYFQFVLSSFIIVITSTLFEETCRPESYAYLCTLPLSIWKMWIIRYIRMLFFLYLIIVPTLIISIHQVNDGIKEYCTTFNLDPSGIRFNGLSVFVSCLLSINLYMVQAIVSIMLLKNRVVSNAVLFAYNLMEMGPWGGFLGEKAVFYGSFCSIPINSRLLPNTSVIVILTFILLLFFYFLYRNKLRLSLTFVSNNVI